MSYVRTGVIAAVAAVAVADGSADAQAPTLALVYAGGFLQETQPRTGVQQFRRALAITLRPDAFNLQLRVAIGMTCSGGRRRFTSDDIRFDAGLNPDGSFSKQQTKRSFELGTALVTVSGSMQLDRATGTIEVTARKGRDRCRSGQRPFVARPVDVKAPLTPGGAPTPGALLVGLSSQSTPVPYPVVARVSRDGRRITQVFAAMLTVCRAQGRLAKSSRYQQDVQGSWVGLRLREGRAAETSRYHETRAQRRRGIRSRGSTPLSIQVSAAGLLGNFSSTESWRQPGYSERCTAGGRHTIRLVPAP
jgi:hypothetical protein